MKPFYDVITVEQFRVSVIVCLSVCLLLMVLRL